MLEQILLFFYVIGVDVRALIGGLVTSLFHDWCIRDRVVSWLVDWLLNEKLILVSDTVFVELGASSVMRLWVSWCCGADWVCRSCPESSGCCQRSVADFLCTISFAFSVSSWFLCVIFSSEFFWMPVFLRRSPSCLFSMLLLCFGFVLQLCFHIIWNAAKYFFFTMY